MHQLGSRSISVHFHHYSMVSPLLQRQSSRRMQTRFECLSDVVVWVQSIARCSLNLLVKSKSISDTIAKHNKTMIGTCIQPVKQIDMNPFGHDRTRRGTRYALLSRFDTLDWIRWIFNSCFFAPRSTIGEIEWTHNETSAVSSFSFFRSLDDDEKKMILEITTSTRCTLN